MLHPVRASVVAPLPAYLDRQLTRCPVALTRAPWVAALLDLRLRVKHTPLATIAEPRPALVEALDVLDQTAKHLQAEDSRREKNRAAVQSKLAAFGRR